MWAAARACASCLHHRIAAPPHRPSPAGILFALRPRVAFLSVHRSPSDLQPFDSLLGLLTLAPRPRVACRPCPPLHPLWLSSHRSRRIRIQPRHHYLFAWPCRLCLTPAHSLVDTTVHTPENLGSSLTPRPDTIYNPAFAHDQAPPPHPPSQLRRPNPNLCLAYITRCDSIPSSTSVFSLPCTPSASVCPRMGAARVTTSYDLSRLCVSSSLITPFTWDTPGCNHPGRSPVPCLPRLTIPPTSGISFALVMAVAPASRRA